VPGNCTTLKGKPVGDASGSVNDRKSLLRLTPVRKNCFCAVFCCVPNARVRWSGLRQSSASRRGQSRMVGSKRVLLTSTFCVYPAASDTAACSHGPHCPSAIASQSKPPSPASTLRTTHPTPDQRFFRQVSGRRCKCITETTRMWSVSTV